MVRPFGAESDRNLNPLDNQGDDRTLGHVERLFAQIDISENVVAPYAFRRNDNIIRVGNVNFNVKTELCRIQRNAFDPVVFLKSFGKGGIYRLAAVAVIFAGVDAAGRRTAGTERPRPAGAVDHVDVNDRVGQALGIDAFAADIKHITVARTAENDNVGVNADVGALAGIKQQGVRPRNLSVKSRVVADVNVLNHFPFREVQQSDHALAQAQRQNQIRRPVIFRISRFALPFAEVLQRIKPGALHHAERVEAGIAHVHRLVLSLRLVRVLIHAVDRGLGESFRGKCDGKQT